MTLVEIVILGVIQGLTEFLPVSSKGHLLAARYLFGIDDTGGLALDAFLHLGTLGAVLVYYWRTWLALARGIARRDAHGGSQRHLLATLAIGTVPAATAGYVLQEQLLGYLRNPHLLIAGFLFTAAVLAFFDLVQRRRETDRLTFTDAAVIGLAQVFALLPGVSRSGMTMAAGRARGLSRSRAATFSFLLSAPIIAGAGLASLPRLVVIADIPLGQLLLGGIASLLSGLGAIYLLLRLIERWSFMPFVVYLVALSVVVWYVI